MSTINQRTQGKMLNTPKRITKKIHPNRAKAIKLRVQNALKNKGITNIPFVNLPFSFLQNFLGTLTQTDVTAIAAFSIINNIDIAQLEIIIETMRSMNLIRTTSLRLLQINHKIASLQQKLRDYDMQTKAFEALASLDQLYSGMDDESRRPLQLPKFFSYSFERNEIVFLDGKKTPEEYHKRDPTSPHHKTKHDMSNLIKKVDINTDEIETNATIVIRVITGGKTVKSINMTIDKDANIGIGPLKDVEIRL